MPHIMELFGKTRIVIRDGKVAETGVPVADWCPVFSKISNVSRLTSKEAQKNMEYRIREIGMFTPHRRFDYGVFVNFGASEIMMTGLERGLIDSTITVCDGAGTVITDNSSLVQGMGAMMSGLIETEPIAEIIAGIEMRGGIVLDKDSARIDQVQGLRQACELGYKNIAVSLVNPAEAAALRLIEKEYGINLILIGAHLTGIGSREGGEIIKELDIITGCASLVIRNLIHPVLQAGTSVPMFALTRKGKELVIERSKDINAPILVNTTELPVLPGHKQPRPLR